MENIHDFIGYHLIANYSGCNIESLTNLDNLRDALNSAIVASGASVLSSNEYIFDGNGFSMVFLLSESHASIHTYPEVNSCFIDIFTCGTECSPEKFAIVIEEYLQPENSSRKMLIRDIGIENVETLF